MIKITDEIWIGDSDDEKNHSFYEIGVDGILNVACDLCSTRDWFDCSVEYMQVGLIDGPGNTDTTYSAAILALSSLLKRHELVMVYCHTGGRSLAVTIMYLIIKSGKNSDHPTFLNYWIPWDKMVNKISLNTTEELPRVHKAHKEVFDKMSLSLIESLI